MPQLKKGQGSIAEDPE